MMDLRFIPDDVTFEHEPRDVATDIPGDYAAPRFHTKALQVRQSSPILCHPARLFSAILLLLIQFSPSVACSRRVWS